MMSITVSSVLDFSPLRARKLTMKQYGTLVLFFGFLFLGCSDDDPQPAPDQTVDLTDDVSGDLDSEESDVDDDATTDPELDDANDAPDLPYGFEPIAHTEPSEDIPATGHDDIKETLDAGEVRAGIVTDWEHGFGGQETDCRPGDFKIYNSVAQFCIAGPTSITSMIYSGGQLTDADFVGESNDRFFMLGPHNDMQLSGADEVRVLDDGRSGTAVVYTRGGEETLKIIEDYVGPILQPNGVTFGLPRMSPISRSSLGFDPRNEDRASWPGISSLPAIRRSHFSQVWDATYPHWATPIRSCQRPPRAARTRFSPSRAWRTPS